MFTVEDAAILQQPGAWEKVKAIQEAFFPKLLALQIEANKLIREIYGIEVNIKYYISQTPTLPSRKGQSYNAKRRQDDDYVLVGLRAKGKPTHLTQPNGKLCTVHFAILAFAAYPCDPHGFLTIQFSPYILQYAERYRIRLSISVMAHRLHESTADCGSQFGDWCYTPEKLSLIETLERPDGFFMAHWVDLLQATQQDFAKLVILFVACFPMLDLFTRLSNGEEVFIVDDQEEQFFPINKPDYATLFEHWYERHANRFIENFQVEPVTEQDIWQSEALTRTLFEAIIGKPFPKTRPSWLKSGRNKSSLELDGYCQELRLAFEYQGEYHYMEIPVHHQQRSLKDVQKTDALKMKLCQKNGVDLVQVPYWEKGNREWIIHTLQNLNRPEIKSLLK